MNTIDAFDAGREAFKAGRERTAAFNTKFMKEACKIARGDALNALKATYEKGWDHALKMSKTDTGKALEFEYDSCEGWD